MKLINSDIIENGKRFVAFYSDGSGAGLFLKYDGGDIYDTEGEPVDFDWLDQTFTYWMYLPDNFKLWFEQ